jgi:glycosyltransferase involved in cell wall biosynthesis
MKNPYYPYVLISAVKNEEAYIGKTMESVISQTTVPKKWIIVNDASTDGTEEIVKSYLEHNGFMQLVNRDHSSIRNFASKVYAIEQAHSFLSGVDYEFVGIVDGDVSFLPNYYDFILFQFGQNPKLGLAGGQIYDSFDNTRIKWITRTNLSVGGPIQMFRRRCYADIGGYRPQPKGGEDAVAEFMVRMCGWEVRTFTEVSVLHHRRMGTATHGILLARFKQGERDYLIGYHPLFEFFKSLRRMVEKPYFIGSFLWFFGFIISWIIRKKRNLPPEVIKFIQKEQISQLFLKK